jgi:hypothetical protein
MAVDLPVVTSFRSLATKVDFSLTSDQQNIRDAFLKRCSQFPDEYWLERDREAVFGSAEVLLTTATRI